MPLTREQYNEIIKIIDGRRRDAQKAQVKRQEEAFSQIPALKRYSEEMGRISQMEVVLRLKNDLIAAAKLKQRREKLREKKAELLKHAGYPKDYLEVHYICKACSDTGFIDNEKCGCFKKLESELLNKESGLPLLMERENFDTLDIHVYNNTVNLEEFLPQRITQYEYMTRPGGVIDTVKNFNNNFVKEGPHNMLMFGPAGTGKTFLTNCLARALIEKQHTVSYERAGDLFDRMSKLNFSARSDPEAESINRRVIESELLIIDDLGTEFATDFTRARFFSIISNRLSNGMSTVISTNLSMNQIKDYYGERVSSRLMGDYILLPFYGADLRIAKGRLAS